MATNVAIGYRHALNAARGVMITKALSAFSALRIECAIVWLGEQFQKWWFLKQSVLAL